MTMGDDFQDQNANEKFKNLDKLIHYVNMEVNRADLLAFTSLSIMKSASERKQSQCFLLNTVVLFIRLEQSRKRMDLEKR